MKLFIIALAISFSATFSIAACPGSGGILSHNTNPPREKSFSQTFVKQTTSGLSSAGGRADGKSETP